MPNIPPRERHEHHCSRMRSEPNMAAPTGAAIAVAAAGATPLAICDSAAAPHWTATQLARSRGPPKAQPLPGSPWVAAPPTSAHRPTASPTAEMGKCDSTHKHRPVGSKRRVRVQRFCSARGARFGGMWRRQQEAGWGKAKSARPGQPRDTGCRDSVSETADIEAGSWPSCLTRSTSKTFGSLGTDIEIEAASWQSKKVEDRYRAPE
ncbi:hypothetical protein C8R47DRAFT_1080009 [Mycena vitilis]|nr:hypothetical protein C8R47DRAFT_1080009 [Mycena vitilis]